ncbi:MAG: helix-turn-helix transcriptional regulator [Bacteroidetes bacterium]|jgi:transcriptional regulator with XRE-family HTH domain|nr:hypothetical protein [Bacteroidota bacterium]MCX6265133.1 helix-turn-helix transcriptional regulator [Bacteroidota bacterium]
MKKQSLYLEKASKRIENRKWLRYSSNIARRIFAAMKEKEGMTQKSLAEKIGVSPQYINILLKGKENLTLSTIATLSAALEIELISFPEYEYSKIYTLSNVIKSTGAKVVPMPKYEYIKEQTAYSLSIVNN